MAGRKISLSRFARRVAKLDDQMRDAVIAALRKSALQLDRRVLEEIDRAKPHPAVDRGELRNSRSVRDTPLGAFVSVDAPHAGIIENGTRPFFPPLEPIKEWVLRKQIANTDEEAARIARLIVQKIGRDGIEPRCYFAKAWKRFVRYGVVTRELRVELRRIGRLEPV